MKTILDYGAVGDGVTPCAGPVEKQLTTEGVARFPAASTLYGSFLMERPVRVNNGHLIGVSGSVGGNQWDSIVSWLDLTQDMFLFDRATPSMRGLTIRPNAGVGGNIISVTKDSITFDKLSNVKLFLVPGQPVPIGQMGWGQQWHYTGISGNTITGVRPAWAGQPFVDPVACFKVAPKRGYFTSLVFQQTILPPGAAVRIKSGCQDPRIKDCWFNAVPTAAIREVGSQGGIWTGNYVDLAGRGFVGNFENGKVFDNEFYGCRQGAIVIDSGKFIVINGNIFQLNQGGDILAQGTYNGVGRTPGFPNLAEIIITNNSSDTSSFFLSLRGATAFRVSGNNLFRCLGTSITLNNSSYGAITENYLNGAGERTSVKQSYYVEAIGHCEKMFIKRNILTHVNAGQGVISAFGGDFSRCIVADNDFDLP